MDILTAVLTLGGLTLLLATLLAVANSRLQVVEDPRIDVVEDLLPHANCGACGLPGCRPFAESLVAGDSNPAQCSVGTGDDHAKIAAYLGVEVLDVERSVARLACAGADNVARDRAIYQGLSSCSAAALVAGGGKSCFWGCLGIGDCDVACDFDAIHMTAQGLPVVDEDKCTGCGDCVVACPKDLFSLVPLGQRLWVQCNSHAHGDEILADCEVACTACGRCAMDAEATIHMQANLPVVAAAGARDPRVGEAAIARCPTGAIVWLDPDRGAVKGPAAKKVLRRTARVDAAT